MKRKLSLTPPERDAILAGLRLLQTVMEKTGIEPTSMIGEILSNSGDHPPLWIEDIDLLCEELNR